MSDEPGRRIIIAGAGIAGLTAALAFAKRGRPVTVFERAGRLEDAGAGLQLSPNATRILDRLGVLPSLLPKSLRPGAVVLRDARTLSKLASIPLGGFAERRWGAPYLALHRADLQAALLAHVGQERGIDLVTGATVTGIDPRADGVIVTTAGADGTTRTSGKLLVGADGVRSTVRSLIGHASGSRFAGQIAWRRIVPSESREGAALAEIAGRDVVSAFLHPGFHLITYPVRGGATFNLVAFTPAAEQLQASAQVGTEHLRRALQATAPALAALYASGDGWSAWPIHTVDPSLRWVSPTVIALIGDAAHAMTPFAAQGAAMAIEDAETLGEHAFSQPNLAEALATWEELRRPRIERVARRGALNHFAWHAGGPIALARNLVLRLRRAESLATDLDWLYGWEP